MSKPHSSDRRNRGKTRECPSIGSVRRSHARSVCRGGIGPPFELSVLHMDLFFLDGRVLDDFLEGSGVLRSKGLKVWVVLS